MYMDLLALYMDSYQFKMLLWSALVLVLECYACSKMLLCLQQNATTVQHTNATMVQHTNATMVQLECYACSKPMQLWCSIPIQNATMVQHLCLYMNSLRCTPPWLRLAAWTCGSHGRKHACVPHAGCGRTGPVCLHVCVVCVCVCVCVCVRLTTMQGNNISSLAPSFAFDSRKGKGKKNVRRR